MISKQLWSDAFLFSSPFHKNSSPFHKKLVGVSLGTSPGSMDPRRNLGRARDWPAGIPECPWPGPAGFGFGPTAAGLKSCQPVTPSLMGTLISKGISGSALPSSFFLFFSSKAPFLSLAGLELPCFISCNPHWWPSNCKMSPVCPALGGDLLLFLLLGYKDPSLARPGSGKQNFYTWLLEAFWQTFPQHELSLLQGLQTDILFCLCWVFELFELIISI